MTIIEANGYLNISQLRACTLERNKEFVIKIWARFLV